VITDQDIRQVVTRNAFDAGLDYHLDGRVQKIAVTPDGSLIEARVKGSGRSPYRQTIRILGTPGGMRTIAGDCTCPVGFNCKHVAAALFAYQDEAGDSRDSADQGLSRNATGLSAAIARSDIGARGTPQGPSDAPLPPEIDAWLRSLEAAHEVESEDYPPTVRKRLLYVLDRGSHSGGVIVDLRSIELKRDGSTNGTSKRYQAQNIMQPGQQPKFLRPSDRALLPRLQGYGFESSEGFITTLHGIIGTGRGRWGAWDGPKLSEGEPVQGTLAWRLSDDGRQRPELQLPGSLMLLRLAVPWYVNTTTGVMGPVETDLQQRVVRVMLSGPSLPPETAARVRHEISRRLPNQALPVPEPVAPPQPLSHPLQPCLQLLTGDLPFGFAGLTAFGRSASPSPAAASHRTPLARLCWRYGPVTLQAGTQRNTVLHDGVLRQVARDTGAEQRAAEQLSRLGLGRVTNHHFLPDGHPHARDLTLADPDPGAWLRFMLHDIPRLRADGWLIEISDDFPLRLAVPSGDISIEIREQPGIDWFDLDLGVMVDGAWVALVPAILDMIADNGLPVGGAPAATKDVPPLLLPLSDGRLLAVPLERLQPIMAPLIELFSGALDEHNGVVRLSRRNAGDLALLEAASLQAGIVWQGGEALRRLGRQLRQHGGIPSCPAPSGFGATLRAYQAHGLAWLQFLRSAGLGGVLADDMGLGKTVQTLAHIAIEQAEGRLDRPALVICPTSLVANWRTEAARFAPSLSTLILQGPDRAERFGAIGAHDLVITTYPLLARDHAVLVAQDWHLVILDEAQTIKNPLAATSKLARTLRARQRLCLSGTPLENHLGELWSVFDFLMPGFLGDRQGFGRRFRTPIEKSGDDDRRATLVKRIAPFLLRRTKQEVAADLPPKTMIAETVEMGDDQRATYEGIRLAMHAKVRAAIAARGLAGSGIVILDALLKLRQACCDPRLLKLEAARSAKVGSAKLERLLELLPPLLEDGRRVLLFSQFTSMLALIETELDRLSIPYVLLTGDTRDRTTPIRRFQDGEVAVFLISLKAGGVGLNLTAADTVIHYDPWWNPAVEDQATDRAHRIGQDKPVFVYRLVTAGTIEEKMEILKERKQALAAGILGASAGKALTMTEGDLDMLFAPVDG
jgi:hypothetical protein